MGKKMALALQQGMMGLGGQNVTAFYRIGPILVCEQGARLRKLDLKVAGADAAHWWRTGKVPLRPTPTMEPRRRFTGYTVKEAKAAAVRELTEGRIAQIRVVQEVQSDRVTAEGLTQEEATQAAKKRVPSEATDVGEPQVTQKGDTGILDAVEATGQKEARSALRGRIPQGARLRNLECIVEPRKGFLGFSKRMGQWQANWTLPFRVEVVFKRPAVVEAILREADQS